MDQPPEITVILNLYKRPEYLEEQIQAIKNQSIKPKEIWLWNNSGSHYWNSKLDVAVDSSRNFKYHGRFALANLVRTEYVALFDDDTIPGKDWFKNCLETEKKIISIGWPKCILGGAGVLLHDSSYVNHTRRGWPSPSNQIDLVDLVGHAWFFKAEYLQFLWGNKNYLENGEDIQFSAFAKTKGGVVSITPPHPIEDKNLWSSIKAWEYGNDSKASSNGSLMSIPKFYAERDEIISHCMKLGWSPWFNSIAKFK